MNNSSGGKGRFTAGLLLVLLSSLCYGVTPALTQKTLSIGVHIETVLASRYMLGLPLVWLYIIIRKADPKVGANKALFMTAVGGIVMLCAVVLNESYRHLPGFIASLLVFLYVIIVVVIEILSGREKPYRSRMICLVAVIVGMIAVVWSPEGQVKLSFFGVLLGLCAAFTYALEVLAMGARRIAGVAAEVIMGYMFIVPALASGARAIAAGQPIFPLEPSQMPYVLLLSLVVGAVGPIIFCQAVKMIGASPSAMINISEPVFAYFAGAIIMSDRILWNATLGGALILAAIMFLNVTEQRRERLAEGAANKSKM
jgi:drug/metabolite transporter (DMT)-like permease